MALQGIERLKATRAYKARIVEAKSDSLAAVVFRQHESVAFVYEGQVRSGIVRRIGFEAVLVHDDARGGLRSFRYDRVDGRPV